MSTSDPDFYETKKFSPEPDESTARGRGCFFYGCLITGILALLLAITIGLTSYVIYRSINEFVQQNTATAPRELPKVQIAPEALQSIKKKVDQFKNTVEADNATTTLVLTADDLNAIIDSTPDLKGQVYLSIEDNLLKGKLSVSLDKLSTFFERFGIKALRGRYFNGEISVKGNFGNGSLNLTIESLEVNGRSLPEPVVTNVNNMIIQFSKDPDIANEMRKIDSIEVKDGKVLIKRQVSKKGTEASPSPTTPDLPDHVLAPPDDAQPGEKPSGGGAAVEEPKPSKPILPAKTP